MCTAKLGTKCTNCTTAVPSSLLLKREKTIEVFFVLVFCVFIQGRTEQDPNSNIKQHVFFPKQASMPYWTRLYPGPTQVRL